MTESILDIVGEHPQEQHVGDEMHPAGIEVIGLCGACSWRIQKVALNGSQCCIVFRLGADSADLRHLTPPAPPIRDSFPAPTAGRRVPGHWPSGWRRRKNRTGD